MKKVILYLATSQDGFIADPKGNVDWLPQPKDVEELEKVGYTQLLNRVDTIFMGRHSYEQILTFGEWSWKDKLTYVFTSQQLASRGPFIHITKESPKQLLSSLNTSSSGKDIWLLGGAQLAQSFATENLIDEIRMTVTSKKLGEGIHLGIDLSSFHLLERKPLLEDMVQEIYFKK